MNNLVEREAFIDSVKVKGTGLKDKFLFEILTALVYGKTADSHVVGRVVREVEMARNCFGSSSYSFLTLLYFCLNTLS